MYTYIYQYLYIHIHIYIYIYMDTHIYTYVYSNTQTDTYTHTHTHSHTLTDTRLPTHTHIHIYSYSFCDRRMRGSGVRRAAIGHTEANLQQRLTFSTFQQSTIGMTTSWISNGASTNHTKSTCKVCCSAC